MNPDGDPRLRLIGAIVGIALCGGYAAMVVGAALGLAWVVVAGLVVVHAAESPAEASLYVRPVLRRAQMPPSARSVLRDLAVLVLVATASWARIDDVHTLVRFIGVVVIARFAVLVVHVIVRRRVLPAVVVRNLEIPRVPGADVPVVLYDDEAPLRMHHLTAVAALGAALAVALHNLTVGVIASAVTLAALALIGAMMCWHLAHSRSNPREQYRAAVEATIDGLRPRFMLYFSGTPESTYQLNMWLSTLERLHEPTVVVLRENVHLEQMSETTLPVVSIPFAVDYMAFAWPTIRVAGYVANVGKNIHMLRERGIRHVFIGHGDSDKTGSFSPFTKAYSEVWVAGPAGRERYVRARVGVREDEIVEVGRPQLLGIQRGRPLTAEDNVVVLYAPTWEGWPGDPPHSSLAVAGERIVAQLLALPKLRVVYKPHPLTGTVSGAVGAASDRIRSMIEEAGGGHRVITGSSPNLYQCFNDSDILIGDISSVVTDFIASEKPYIMVNLHGGPDQSFRDEFASAAAAYLLRPDGGGLAEAISACRGSDPMSADRQRARLHLLGSRPPGDIAPLADAIDAAAHAAEELWPVRPAPEPV